MCKILLALGFLVAGLNLAHAETDAVDELVDFLAGQGCAIGPATRDAAIAAGFTAEEIDAYAGAALSEGSAAREGEWVVLPTETCEIRPPEITPAIKLSDPEVMAAISAIDEYEGDPGCFLTVKSSTKISRRREIGMPICFSRNIFASLPPLLSRAI